MLLMDKKINSRVSVHSRERLRARLRSRHHDIQQCPAVGLGTAMFGVDGAFEKVISWVEKSGTQTGTQAFTVMSANAGCLMLKD